MIWDAGDEQWELYSNGIRRYRILERRLVSLPDSSVCVREVVEFLPESPVPILVFARHSMEGWDLVEKVLAPLQLSSQRVKKPMKVDSAKAPLPTKKQSVSSSSKQEEEEQEDLRTLPEMLDCWDWSSLSQWIPSSALFQASLHDQAFLEESPEPVVKRHVGHRVGDRVGHRVGVRVGDEKAQVKAHKPRYHAPRARVAVAHA
jgi:hypothetical protein